ncbi:MAG: ABC transporter ATP-binding protein [Deltaproteobacteria bacterium]|nr:ABC transporter ATP-binding protein [Deltaproteobacteria bacterium]
MLRVENLSKSFSGRMVIEDLSFSVAEGELSAIIGPNGAGKTTLFNLITGYHVPDSGKIIFNGQNIAGLQPFKTVRLGLARAFQRTNIFPKMTVLENVVSACITRQERNLNFRTPYKKLTQIHQRAYEILDSVGLTDMAQRLSGTLAHGNQKLLDIALALALEPRLLLLDEPTAGMSPDERWQTVALVKDLWERLKVTMVFIEHDMDIVFGISQKIRVLCYGNLLAEGTPKEISNNLKVIEVYLGEKPMMDEAC